MGSLIYDSIVVSSFQSLPELICKCVEKVRVAPDGNVFLEEAM